MSILDGPKEHARVRLSALRGFHADDTCCGTPGSVMFCNGFLPAVPAVRPFAAT